MGSRVAIVGATGVVGMTMQRVLAERRFPADEVVLFASEKSAGRAFDYNGEILTVRELNEKNVRSAKIDIAIFSAGATISKKFAPLFVECGGVVVDNSSCWRMDKDVPLVVPEVNPQAAFGHKGIIANPNCSTIQAVVALKPLYDAFGIKRIVYTTYQAVSGAGRGGLEDLTNGVKNSGAELVKFPYRIAYNVLPQIDVITEDGYTKEEHKMINETRKIFGDGSLRITATTARVPVFYGHSESINVEFYKPVTRESAVELLKSAPGVKYIDEQTDDPLYPMPIDAAGKDDVFVGRVRVDKSVESGLDMWVVADNIRKGAATNAIQIAELLVNAK